MSWRDSLRPGSFRGVPFFTASHTEGGGRRTALHEFPGRDVPYAEDMGKQAGENSLEAYVVGEDYHLDRDRLRDALNAAGPGALVHPYLGTLQVLCEGFRLSESTAEGRVARFSITFREAGAAVYPDIKSDPVAAISGAASAVNSAAADAFADGFTIEGFASFVTNGAAELLSDLSETLGGLLTGPTGAIQDVAAWAGSVASLSSQALGLIQAPGLLASRVLGIVYGIASVFGSRSPDVYGALQQAYAPRPPTGGTPGSVQADANARALAFLIRQSCIVAHAQLAVVTWAQGGTLGTRDDAITLRDTLADALDVEQERDETTAAMFSALAGMRAAIVRNIPPENLSLPRVVSYTPPATAPSILIAYHLYADAGRGQEIAERNRVPHPGFIQGGRALTVLADG